MSRTNVKNADNVSFGNMEIQTTLNGGYDSDTPKELKREVSLTFTGFDKLDNDIKESLLSELAAKIRIKVNQTDGVLKGNAHDSESYAEYLDEKECSFTFDVNELYKPSKRGERTPRQVANMLLESGQITEAQYEQMLDIVKE